MKKNDGHEDAWQSDISERLALAERRLATVYPCVTGLEALENKVADMRMTLNGVTNRENRAGEYLEGLEERFARIEKRLSEEEVPVRLYDGTKCVMAGRIVYLPGDTLPSGKVVPGVRQ